MLALLGSKALAFYCDIGRTPMDTDYLGSYEDCTAYIKELGKREQILCNYPAESGKKIIVKTDKGIYEFEIAWSQSNSEKLVDIIFASCELIKDGYGNEMALPHLDVLYMIKSSHKYRKNSPHFLKTLNDLKLMESVGAQFPEQYKEWFVEREKLTYTNSLPKLNVDKKNFFQGDGIVYEWCHDSLHEAIAFGDRPAYLEYAGGEVWSDMKKFATLPERIKLLGVLEEACVLAAERSQLSFNPPPTEHWSFEMALSKVCTSITSGIFRAYAYSNYHSVVAMYDDFGYTYMDKVRQGIATGVVKRLKETK